MSEKNYITQSELKHFLHYCPETGAFTNRISRRGGVKEGTVAGTIEAQGYRVIGLKGRSYKAHRLAWLYMTGELPKYPEFEVDHRDHSKTNNAWSNLRLSTHKRNCRNKGLNSNSLTGVTGVTWNKKISKWLARIYLDGKLVHLGCYTCITAAAIARKAADIKHGFHPNHGG